MPKELISEMELEKIPIKFAQEKQSSLLRDAWQRLKKNKLAMFGLAIATTLILVAILAPVLAPYDPLRIDFNQTLKAPSLKHPLGTDDLGRDLLSRILYGSRVSVEVGIIAVGIGLIIGLLMGSISGYFGRFADSIIMRTADIFFAIPYVLFAITIMTVLGPGLTNVFIAIGILEWAHFARLFRGSILSVKENDYVEAARAIGAGNFRIILFHIFPNAIAPIIVYAAMGVGGAIITEAALSFLGIGVQPPQPTWGKMLAESRAYMATAAWLMYFPGLAILITVLGFVLLSDGLRDAFDPRLK